MKTIEKLLNLESGAYDTPKKLNRSGRAIPAAVIERIESGTVTSEDLGALDFPVFRYKTCITVHGRFDLETLPRIGGYKNLIQNKNGSLEIRYTAIDWERKKQIQRALRAVRDAPTPGPAWAFFHDSAGTILQQRRMIKDRAGFDADKLYMQGLAERIRQADFYGKTSLYIGADFMGNRYLVLDVILDAITGPAVRDFVERVTMTPWDVIGQLIDKQDQAAAIEDQKRAAERAKSEEIQARKTAAVEELRAAISHLPEFDFEIGSIGVKGTSFLRGGIGYRFVRICGKGSFGRVTVAIANGAALDSPLYFKAQAKQLKKTDYQLQGLRQIDPRALVLSSTPG